MKWARVKGKPSSEEERINNEICFQEYDTRAELEKQLEKKKNIWAQYVFKANFKEPVEANYKAFQGRYEVFCGGFLLFYDDFLRSKSVDHVLHMKWSEFRKGSNKYSVTIFLSPEPMKPLKKPVIVKEVSYQDSKSEEIVFEAQRVDSGMGDSVDPPPPPPPPPPTMH